MNCVRPGNYFDTIGQAKKIYGRRMEPLCRKWTLTHSELDILLFLYNHPEYDRAVDIVTRRGIAKSHVSLSVGTLETKLLLVREEDPGDRRTVHLRLTQAGQVIAEEGRQLQRRYFDTVFAGITPEELEVWQGICDRVVQNLRDMDPHE